MRKFLILGLLISGFFIISMSYGSESIIKVATGEWSPFMSETLNHYGFINHIITKSFEIEKIKTSYEFYPWVRAMLYIEKNIDDASSAWYWNEERSKKFYFSDPVFIEQQVFFYLKDKPFSWKVMEDLKDKEIGAVIGYYYGDSFKKGEELNFLQISRVPSDEQNLKKLLLGRIDVLVASLFVGKELLRTKFSAKEMSKVTYHPQPVNDGPLHLIFNKNTKGYEWMIIFNRGLGKLKASGQYDQIINNALNGEYSK